MTVEIRLSVPESALTGYDTIRVERASTPDGFLAAGASQIASIPLVEDVTSYLHHDLTGRPDDWYRTRYATDVPAFSDYSDPFQGVLPPLLTLETALRELGLAADSPRVWLMQLLLDAISAEVRRISGRGLEGSPTVRDEIYPLDGRRYFWLKGAPVSAVDTIRRVAFDGTEDPVYEADRWRLENPDTGLIKLMTGPPYVRVVYTSTGSIAPQFVLATLEWLKARWEDWGRDHALASYSTGADSESYNTAVAGMPPANVGATLSALSHAGGLRGGPV